MLQQVFVLQQQLVDSSLRLQSGRGLRAQLVPQKVDLQEMMRSEDGREQSHQACSGIIVLMREFVARLGIWAFSHCQQ